MPDHGQARPTARELEESGQRKSSCLAIGEDGVVPRAACPCQQGLRQRRADKPPCQARPYMSVKRAKVDHVRVERVLQLNIVLAWRPPRGDLVAQGRVKQSVDEQ